MKAAPDSILSSPLGKHLTEQQASDLAARMRVIELGNRQQLVDIGDDQHTLYLLVEGALDVTVRTQGRNDLVHTMRPGECAGTHAFIEQSPRVAALAARGDTIVYALEPEDLEGLLDKDAGLVYDFMRGLVTATHNNLYRMYLESEQLTNYVMRMHGRY